MGRAVTNAYFDALRRSVASHAGAWSRVTLASMKLARSPLARLGGALLLGSLSTACGGSDSDLGEPKAGPVEGDDATVQTGVLALWGTAMDDVWAAGVD